MGVLKNDQGREWGSVGPAGDAVPADAGEGAMIVVAELGGIEQRLKKQPLLGPEGDAPLFLFQQVRPHGFTLSSSFPLKTAKKGEPMRPDLLKQEYDVIKVVLAQGTPK